MKTEKNPQTSTENDTQWETTPYSKTPSKRKASPTCHCKTNFNLSSSISTRITTSTPTNNNYKENPTNSITTLPTRPPPKQQPPLIIPPTTTKFTKQAGTKLYQTQAS